MNPPTLEKATSRDGTPIAAWRSGDGPPIVLVHGGSGSHWSWRFTVPLLEQHYTVYAIQRRGRGESGDASEYSIRKEGEDIAALIKHIGGEVNLVGHSYGGVCALEASLLTQRLRRLVLYEPSVEWSYPPGFLDALDVMLAEGNREEVLLAVLEDAGISPEELEMLRTSPTWPERVALAHTLPREGRAEEAYKVDQERFAEMTTPTLLLVGSETADGFKRSVEIVDRVLPNSHVVVLPGQGHAATVTAPGLFVDEVHRFLIS